MNRLVCLSTTVIKCLKDKYPGATRFTFSVEVDKDEFKDSEFSRQLLEHLALRELEQIKGWKACEQFFLARLKENKPFNLGDKKVILSEIKNDANLCPSQNSGSDDNNNPTSQGKEITIKI